MQDINVIARQNAEAAEQEGLNAARKAGKFVVAKYSGLHLVGFTPFDDRDAAVDAAHAAPDSPAEHFKLLNPIAPAPEQTLGQYIERKIA